MAKFNVFGVGNALVDIVVRVEDSFLKDNKIRKGVMTLVDTTVQNQLLSGLSAHSPEKRSGGSAANTLIGVANAGGTGYYTGKVSADDNGNFYKTDMIKAGIEFHVPPGSGHTGTCLVMTTHDGERTMLTSLGISSDLHKTDINIDALNDSEIAYVEGYLWDKENTKEASLFTMQEAKRLGKKVAFTFSDPFCVNRSRDDFKHLTKEYVDIAFCNHEEAMALTQTDSPEDAIQGMSEYCELVFMTWGHHGSMISMEGVEKHIPGYPVKAIDSNGAGDAFAAGVLYGITHGYSNEKACKWGNYMASCVIQNIGPRLPYLLKGKQEEILGQ
jgi:sugar/nucleoside kinase (ribokinase family)